MKKIMIGVDLGGTKIAIGSATESGKIMYDTFLATPRTTAESIYQAIKDSVKIIYQRYRTSLVAGIGIGLPGLVDIKKGTVLNAPNLAIFNRFPIAKRLHKDFKVPIVIDNDANAAALAESMFGAGKKYRSFVYMTVSTGIGAGIILDKKIYYGSHLTSGEVGHIIIEAGSGAREKNAGKLEILASGTGLARRAVQQLKPSSVLYDLCEGDAKKMTAALIYDAANQGDDLAKKLVDEHGLHLAAGIVNITNILDPEAIILGGGVTNNGPLFFKTIEKGLRYFELMTPSKKITLLPAKLKKHVGLYGAFALVMQHKA